MAKAIAFVTYNTVGDGLSSGWHGSGDRRAFVVQNSTGRRWGASTDPVRPGANTDANAGRVMDEIDTLWGQLQQALSELDHVVVYVGDRGSEVAIDLAAKLPASKVTFVLCSCNRYSKVAMIQRAGLTDARLIGCECGGHGTM